MSRAEGPARAGGPGGRRRSSLAVRLTLLVVTVAVAVAAFAGVVGSALVRSTAADVTRNYLAGQADVIESQLSGEQPGYRIGLVKLAQVLGQQGIAVITVDRAGALEGSDAVAVRAASQAGVTGLLGGRSVSATVSVAGRTMLVEGRSLTHRGFALVAAADLGGATQRSLQRRILLALLIGVAVAILGGLVLASRMARPLRRTAAVARSMGAGARDVRAQVAGPVEVAEVAAAVNELADALQHSENRQRAFLTSVSHELRTPLTGILGQGEALADGIVGPDETGQVGRTIVTEATRLDRLVSDLLDLARLGADTFRLDPAPCDLTGLVRESVAAWQPRCDQRGIPLTAHLPPGPVVVITDARRVRQVLDALIDNAVRLLGPGRPLVLALSPWPGPGPGPGPFAGGGERPIVVLEVRDGGPGLDPQDYPVAFEAGVLHERYRGRRPGGAGLGLALVGTLVGRLGGRILAGPAAEGGVAMRIELPG